MISLKKNDKIIVVVAIAVILTASIGIALYTSPKPTTPPAPSSGEKTFDVIRTERNGTLKTISEFSAKKTPYETIVNISEGNLKTITFNLSWIDDKTTFFGRMGLDTLSLEVMTPDQQVYDLSNTSAKKTKEGHILLTVTVDNIRPPETPIKANDIQSAQAKLLQKPYYYDTWTGKDIKITVSVHIGELRILKKIRDKGNDFDLKISYQYYYCSILKKDITKDTGLDNDTPPQDPWDNQETPPYMSMIINTGCGRFV